MVLRIILLTLLFVGISRSFYGQPIKTDFEITAAFIREKNSKISFVTLERDYEKIKTKFFLIEEEFATLGCTDKCAVQAVLLGWEQVRIDSPLQYYKSIDSPSFVQFMTKDFLVGNGRVDFVSTPEQVALTVNGHEMGSTKISKWYPINENLSVTCKKDGYEDLVTSCTVAPGKSDCPCTLVAKKE